MVDNLIPHALSGNKSHRAKLEAVRLQMIALRAIEAHLEDLISESERASDAAIQEKAVRLPEDQIGKILSKMQEKNFVRADPQSSSWAGIVVTEVVDVPSGQSRGQFSKNVIEFLLSINAIERVALYDKKRGRDIPVYKINNFPTCDL